jgi:guanylate kinase
MVVSAPSGAGKTTLCTRLKERFTNLTESISYTTRSPRPGEVDGTSYHFVSNQQFQAMVAEQAFVEWAEVHGNWYGTARATLVEARQAGIDILLDIDCQGARSLKDQGVPAVFVFIMPPSLGELRRRLESRSSDAPEVIERRMVRAVDEIAEARWYDYIVLNESLDEALDGLASILVATRFRTDVMLPQIAKLFEK